MFRLVFYHHLFVLCDSEENTDPLWRGKGLVVIVLVTWCSELKISEANVSGRADFLLELMLLLDKTGSSGVAQVLVKFRNKTFQDKVLGEGVGEAYVESFWVRLYSIFLSFSFNLLFLSSPPAIHACVFSLFDTRNLCLPVCFSVHPGCQASCDQIASSVVTSTIPCLFPPQMLQMVI